MLMMSKKETKVFLFCDQIQIQIVRHLAEQKWLYERQVGISLSILSPQLKQLKGI